MGWDNERDEELEEARMAELAARRAQEEPVSEALKAVFDRARGKQVWAPIEGNLEHAQVVGVVGKRGAKPEAIIVQTRDGDKSARVWTKHEVSAEALIGANPELG